MKDLAKKRIEEARGKNAPPPLNEEQWEYLREVLRHNHSCVKGRSLRVAVALRDLNESGWTGTRRDLAQLVREQFDCRWTKW